MRIKILNTWASKPQKLEYFDFSESPVYTIGDYAIYRSFSSYVYTYKYVAVNQLVGLNKEHLNRLASARRPVDYDASVFLYDRAMENKRKALQLLTL